MLAERDYYVYATVWDTTKIPEELSRLPNVNILESDVSSIASVVEAARAMCCRELWPEL